ncbi:MAG: hypothetical protein ACRDVG_10220 [Jatrophihabitantaceae bacterium]
MNDIPTAEDRGAGQYEIRVSGHLARRWAAWFDGMTLTHHDDGTTVIHGTVADQSALHGLLRKLNDLGVPLVSVTPAAPNGTTDNQAADPAAPIHTAHTHTAPTHTMRRSTT